MRRMRNLFGIYSQLEHDSGPRGCASTAFWPLSTCIVLSYRLVSGSATCQAPRLGKAEPDFVEWPNRERPWTEVNAV